MMRREDEKNEDAYDKLSQLNNELANARRELYKKNMELNALNEKLESLSVHDPLTGLYNRRYLFQQSSHIAARAKRSNTPLCMVMIDVNGFKAVNDTLGHDEGDKLLNHIADCFVKVVRQGQDLVCRLGGDEFLVVLEQCDLLTAKAVMNRVSVEYQTEARGTTLAMGILEVKPSEITEDFEVCIRKTDALMYMEKKRMKEEEEVL